MRPTEETIFAEALVKQDPLDRAAFLDKACAGNPSLRESVESLLAAYVAGEFLENADPGLRGTIDLPPIAEAPGADIGPYKLLEQIGEGGMGLVFQAEQVRPVRRRVALKIIKPGMDSKQVIARFEAERQALALMEHPNIARVLDAGTTASGRPYFVMELVRGVPITEYCDNHKLTIRQRLELFTQVCQAVQHAHQKGVIHRDLKPNNVLVAHDDTVPIPKVIDFGIAKATGQSLTDNTLFTAISQVVGTPRYMSPEQAALNHLDVDTRSDVYSLGVLLYELLTGTTPFEEDRLRKLGLDEIRRIIIEEEPPRPSTRMSTLGAALTTVSERRRVEPQRMSSALRGELDWIVMKSLEKDRRRRYESASAFAADLDRYMNDEPVQACPPSATYRLRKFVRRHKGPVLAATVLLIALVLGIIGTSIGLVQANESEVKAIDQAGKAERARADEVRERSKAELARVKEAQEREKAAAARDTAQDRLYAAQMPLAQRAWNRGDVGRARELLESHRPEGEQRDRRGWEWYYLQGLCNSAQATLETEYEDVKTLLWSPNSRHILVQGKTEEGIQLWDTLTGTKQIVAYENPFSTAFCWNLDGKQLAWVRHQGIALWDVATGKMRVIPCKTPSSMGSLAWRPDGQRIASIQYGVNMGTPRAEPSRIQITEPKSGNIVQSFEIKEFYRYLAWSPDGMRLAGFNNNTSFVSIWDLATGTKTLTFRPTKKNFAAPRSTMAWSPDGRKLMVNREVWDTTTGTLLITLGGPWHLHTAWSPDGKWLAGPSSNSLQETQIWDANTGKEVRSFRGLTDPPSIEATCVAWSPDGKQLASSGGSKVLIWDCTREQEYYSLFGHSKQVACVAWNSDGNLATASKDGSIKVWDATVGREIFTVQTEVDQSPFLAWSPDGKSLAARVKPANSIRVWRSTTGQELLTFQIPLRGTMTFPSANGIAWSPDGRQVALASNGGALAIWDLNAKRLVVALNGDFGSLAWSPDGRWLAAAPNVAFASHVLIYDTSTWKDPIITPYSQRQAAIAWKKDSQLLAVSDGKTVKLWNVATQQEVLSLRGHAEAVQMISWNPDGKRLASVSADNTLKIWDLVEGQEVFNLPGATASIAWSTDGRKIAAASLDNSVRIWDMSRGDNVANPAMTLTANQLAKLSLTRSSLASSLGHNIGQWAMATQYARDAVALQEKAVAKLPHEPTCRRKLIERQLSLAEILKKVGSTKEAESYYRQALRASETSPFNGITIQICHLLEESGRAEEAEALYRQAMTAAAALKPPSNDSTLDDRKMFDMRLVISNEFAGLLARAARYGDAIEQFKQSIELFPKSSFAEKRRAENELAWLLTTCGDIKFRDPVRALELAKLPSMGSEQKTPFLKTLGAAHYRAGSWKEAAATLTEYSTLQRGTMDAFSSFFLAMAQWQEGEMDAARHGYLRTLLLMDIARKDHSAGQKGELRGLHSEAAKLMRVELYKLQEKSRLTGSVDATKREQIHEHEMRADTTYVIDLESKDFDTFLRLENSQGKNLAENDDIEPGVNTNSRLIFTPPSGGVYRLIASAFQQSGIGPYSLTVREFVK